MIFSHLLIAWAVTGVLLTILSMFLYLFCFSPVFALRDEMVTQFTTELV